MSLKGVVKDEFGTPLWGVNVTTMFRPQNIGVTTNERGVFTIADARSEESWKLTHIGFEEVFFNMPRNGGFKEFTMQEKAFELDGFTGTPEPKTSSKNGYAILAGVVLLGLIVVKMQNGDS